MQRDYARADLALRVWDFEEATKRVEQLEAELAATRAQRDAARAEIERLRGIKPELPPYPPGGDGMPRYGIRWNGPKEPIAVPMPDGYWTPWHLSADAIDTARREGAEAMREAASVTCLETHTSYPDAVVECAERIRALPLPGDKP